MHGQSYVQDGSSLELFTLFQEIIITSDKEIKKPSPGVLFFFILEQSKIAKMIEFIILIKFFKGNTSDVLYAAKNSLNLRYSLLKYYYTLFVRN